jgi:hypothetical protein
VQNVVFKDLQLYDGLIILCCRYSGHVVIVGAVVDVKVVACEGILS